MGSPYSWRHRATTSDCRKEDLGQKEMESICWKDVCKKSHLDLLSQVWQIISKYHIVVHWCDESKLEESLIVQS